MKQLRKFLSKNKQLFNYWISWLIIDLFKYWKKAGKRANVQEGFTIKRFLGVFGNFSEKWKDTWLYWYPNNFKMFLKLDAPTQHDFFKSKKMSCRRTSNWPCHPVCLFKLNSQKEIVIYSSGHKKDEPYINFITRFVNE